MRIHRVALSACALLACAPEGESPAQVPSCRVLQPPRQLPGELAETSGAAVSRQLPELLWTHNDSGSEPVLYAIRPTGAEVGSVRVRGAENDDWEDLAAGPCPAGSCLFIADIGDNEGDRDEVAIYRVAEPEPGAARTAPAERFPIRYPGGPRDAESLFVLPTGDLYLITKGRNSNVAIYRYPPPLRAGETVELEKVVDLSPGRRELQQQVTAASATPDGRWVAVREYTSLALYRTEPLLRGDTTPALRFDLRPLDEPQGEAVVLLDNGRVVLTSEGPGQEAPGLITVLDCALPE